MTNQEAVKLIDETARFIIWSDGPCGWVKGTGWETKIMFNEERAWGEAVSLLYAKFAFDNMRECA
jgi:hypothetical protein